MSIERYFGRALEVSRAATDAPALQTVLDRAMADWDGAPTLGPGEGAEARRMLGMVAWGRVPRTRRPEVFDTLRMAAVWRDGGHPSWEPGLRDLLRKDGWLAEAPARTAA